MPERLLPIFERVDLLLQTYDAGLARRLLATETTPKPGATVDLSEAVTVTFERAFVRRGAPAPDALLFTLDANAPDDSDAIATWLTDQLHDESFVRVETRHELVEPDDVTALQNALETLLTPSEA